MCSEDTIIKIMHIAHDLGIQKQVLAKVSELERYDKVFDYTPLYEQAFYEITNSYIYEHITDY
jgi:hypothetical protein